jgi:hypothetical protein
MAMTHHKRSAVTCDTTTGCNEVVVDDGPDARRYAKAAGWITVRSRDGHTIDLCPAHKDGPR